MKRIEKQIMKQWEFALGDGEKKEFKPIVLPHDWAIDAPISVNVKEGAAQGYRDRWNVGWYRREIELEKKSNDIRYIIHFGGVFENCTVWMNGKEVGGHKYGYSPFETDVTDAVKEGKNELLVRVDNTLSPADRWYSGCGIYRTVKWLELPLNHLSAQDVVIHTSYKEDIGCIKVKSGCAKKVRGLLKKDGKVYEGFGENGEFEITVPEVQLWSAEKPNLYDFTLQLLEGEKIVDEISRKVGIREVIFDPEKGMLVNGKKVKLKGVCLHQEVGCRGIAAKKEIWKQRLEVLKEMGCNAIRCAHHVHSEEFMDLCDEMGFYVYEECFDKWTGGLYGRYFQIEWKKDIDAMVKRDRNRPCTVIWGVGNEVENQAQDSMLNILKMLYDYVKSLDNTRPVTYAMNPHFKRECNVDVSKVEDIQKFVDEIDDTEIFDAEERVERIKKIAEIVDIISCNYQEQWYDMIHKAIPDKLILGSEVYQYFMDHRDEMKNYSAFSPVLAAEEKEYCIGSFIWSGYDYIGESTGYPSTGWTGALIRTNMEKRPGFYMMQSYWSKKPMVHFFALDYSMRDEKVKEAWGMPMYAEHWQFSQYGSALIPYMITSNCEKVELYVNEKRYLIPQRDQFENRLITGYMPWIPGKVTVIGYENGAEVCRQEVTTAGAAVQLKAAQEEIEVPQEEGYERLISVYALDEAGNRNFHESSVVRFRVEGDAEIVGADAGDLMSHECYTDTDIHMYQGCASVVVRMNNNKGRAILSAYAQGMRSAKIVIVSAREKSLADDF